MRTEPLDAASPALLLPNIVEGPAVAVQSGEHPLGTDSRALGTRQGARGTLFANGGQPTRGTRSERALFGQSE